MEDILDVTEGQTWPRDADDPGEVKGSYFSFQHVSMGGHVLTKPLYGVTKKGTNFLFFKLYQGRIGQYREDTPEIWPVYVYRKGLIMQMKGVLRRGQVVLMQCRLTQGYSSIAQVPVSSGTYFIANSIMILGSDQFKVKRFGRRVPKPERAKPVHA